MPRPIYLDYNGTTPHDPEVVAAMRPFLETEFGNPSSGHAYGAKPREAVANARRQVAALLDCRPGEILFTSGGTESNNHAILGVARRLREKGNHIITSAFEHPAVLEVCRYLASDGFETTYLPVSTDGLVDPADVEKALRPTTILITIMHANNEVGTLQPITAISRIARRHGILLHTDAAQSVGKVPVEVDALGVDLLSVAGHKLYAPKGVGVLYVRSPLTLEKFCHGAGQESGWRAGTENVLEIVGLGKACEIARQGLEMHMVKMKQLRDSLYTGLTEAIPTSRLNGHAEQRLPNTLSIAFKDIEAQRLLDTIGSEVAASAGAACHADTVEISHVLKAMAVPLEWAQGTVRFSLGRMTTAEEIEKTIQVVAAVARLQARQ
ncbi:MAG: cysteine desulfurase family protein [Desulfobacterales bacterium]|nr:cysteine desulfurase family protein [Desulfobacterales bacterium]